VHYASPEASGKVTKVKAPTLLASIKALCPPNTVASGSLYNDDDIEIQHLISVVRTALKKKIGNSYSSKFTTPWYLIQGGTNKSVDPVAFLTSVLKLFGINASDSMYTPGKKVEPGKFYGLPVPKDDLTTHAKTMLPNPANAPKIAALADKIKAFEAEISRLKALQIAADKAKSKAETEKGNLTSKIDEKLLKYFSYIEKTCGQYLKDVKETRKFLCRGQHDASQPVFIAHPRADREPKDSGKKASQQVDAALSASGFKALRSNSIFTSADYDQASNYGDVFAIFPKDGFSFTWSTKHDDLVINNLSDFIDADNEDNVSSFHDDLNDDVGQFADLFDDVEEYLKYSLGLGYGKKLDELTAGYKAVAKTPQMQTFAKLIKQWEKYDPYKSSAKIKDVKEMFINVMNAYTGAKEVYPILAKAFTAPQLKRIAKQIAQFHKDMTQPDVPPDLTMKIIDGFGFTNKNFQAALKSEHEVCILGEYIAVDFDRYRDELVKYFLGPKPPKVNKKAPIKKSSVKKSSVKKSSVKKGAPFQDNDDDEEDDYSYDD
jgi:hypothetical protein